MNCAEVLAEDALERKLLGRDDVDVDVARAQRRRHLEPDEARADRRPRASPSSPRR